MRKYKANDVESKFYWIIPLLFGISKTFINKKSENYSIFITPFIEISFNCLGNRHGYDIDCSDISDESGKPVINNKEQVKKILQYKFNYTDDVLAERIDKLYEKS